jgi:hypothetical protein
MANLLTSQYPSEAKTQPPESVEPESPFRLMVGDLVERMAEEVVRYGEALPLIRSDALKTRHFRYLAWLNDCILNDMQALKTLSNADAQFGNPSRLGLPQMAHRPPSPDAVRFLNATIETAERDLTALTIVCDWLTTLESR